jgi:short-subunit dehydrogenase
MNNTALITGASSGIGLELAREFAKHRTDVVLVARNEKKLQETAQELTSTYGVKAIVIAEDLSRPEGAEELFRKVHLAGLEIGYLVNSAGLGTFGMFAESDWRRQQETINVNIMGLTQLCRLFLPEMILQKQGRILNVASTAAFQPGPTMAVYFASKSFVLLFSEALANELKSSGITVTALCPGPTASGFKETASMQESNLFKNKKVPSSADVAAFGYRMMMKGKSVAIHGLKNRVLVFATRFAPRDIATAISKKMTGK